MNKVFVVVFISCISFAFPFQQLATSATSTGTSNSVSNTTTATTENSTITTYCAFDQKTYTSLESARNDGGGVMHCEDCGYCSNYHDITLFNETKNSLTTTATFCAAINSILGRQFGTGCFNYMVGFTPDCNNCWIENFICTRSNCFWTCMGTFLSGLYRNNNDGTLSPCLQCDEDKCGPAFKDCAGANRRRAGIVTDIDRPGDEICEDIDRPWPGHFE